MDSLLPLLLYTAHNLSVYSTVLTSHLLSASSPLRSYLSSNPDLTTIALLLIILYLSIAILGMATRWIYGMVVMVIRLAFLVGAVAVGVWVYSVGAAEAVKTLAQVAESVRGEIEKGGREGWAHAAEGKGYW
jgi:phosphoglycerol transferase MdoB-like AlkP superfamily enzyme